MRLIFFIFTLILLFSNLSFAFNTKHYVCNSAWCPLGNEGVGQYDLYIFTESNYVLKYSNKNSLFGSFNKFNTGNMGSYLKFPESNKCMSKKQNLNIVSNLKSLQEYLPSGYTIPLIENTILQNYYYMNTSVTYKLYFPDGTLVPQQTDSKIILVKPITGTTIPTSHKFTLLYVQTVADTNQQWGAYKVKVSAIPIDLKCDFNKNGGLEVGEVQGFLNKPFTTISTTQPLPQAPTISLISTKITTSTTGHVIFSVSPLHTGISCSVNNGGINPATTGFDFDLGNSLQKTYIVTCSNNGGSSPPKSITIKLDSDGDGVPNNIDNCPSVFGDSQRAGCPEYTFKTGDITSCVGLMNFNQTSQTLNCLSDMHKTDNNHNCIVGSETNCGWIDIPGAVSGINPNTYQRGNNRYLCVKDNSGFWPFVTPETVKGYCDLTFHPIIAESPCTLPDLGGTQIQSGVSRTLFTKDVYTYKEQIQSINLHCSNGNILENAQIFTNTQGSIYYKNYFKLSSDTLGTIYDPITRTLIYNDTITQYKVRYNINTQGLTFIGKGGTQTAFIAPTINTTNKNIKIYKQGVLDRTEAVDPSIIALKAHKIRKFKSQQKLSNFVQSSVNLMTKFQIIKNLTYDPLTNKTTVQIRIENVPTADQVNITIYQVLSKDLAQNLNDINFISDGGAQRIILDKDPVIGWYFNDSGNNGSVSYNVSGNNEGGTIIITQEPILFNEGELIINYREGGCNFDEAYFFDLEDLENSRIFAKGSGKKYQVCIAHLTQTLYEGTAHTPNKHIFSYTTASNASIDDSYGVSSVDISVDQITPKIYWDMKIQETNPTGNYSCLGSVNNEQSSLFGDCGYTLKRVWLHLGRDYFPPNTSLSYPHLSHSVRVELTATDNIGGSGVDKTFYCFDDTGECNPIGEYTEPFTITCAQDWGCLKYVKFYSTDIEGNVESIKIQNIRILDKGSACVSDCTAKPSPNRYLKECRNLNSCEYYPLSTELADDKGKYVANLCDFLIKNSWVSYNATHDIQCPNGPLKLTKFTNIGIDSSQSSCGNLIKTPYIALFDGQQIIMNILSCTK